MEFYCGVISFWTCHTGAVNFDQFLDDRAIACPDHSPAGDSQVTIEP